MKTLREFCCCASDFIVGTVHKAKGLEFSTVLVCDDFIKIPPAGEPLCYYYCPQFSESPPPSAAARQECGRRKVATVGVHLEISAVSAEENHQLVTYRKSFHFRLKSNIFEYQSQ